MSNGTKTILFITIYRISQSTNKGVYKVITQYNQMMGEMKNATTYRKSIL